MAQIVVWGHRESLRSRRTALSHAIHAAVVEALDYPIEKRFHRFVGLDDEDFMHPQTRSQQYVIIEISMFEGRSEAAKRLLIERLFERIETEAATSPEDVEITIVETPRSSWGIRGRNAADLTLDYRVEV
ncbi:tautomerase family protein [Agrococcus jejuensis]|nr:tautomerase family protein [Agrococcus jejuensis]